MRGKLTRRQIDRMENILIAILACTALFLFGQTNMFQTITGQGAGQESTAAYSGVRTTELPQSPPAALMVQNDLGRWGVRYDQADVDRLYGGGLEDLLCHALDKMERPKPSDQEAWQQAVTQGETWVCYDFLYNIPFVSAGGQEGEARLFLVTLKGGQAEDLYCYDQETGEYWVSRVGTSGLTMPALAQALSPNQARFVFEVPDLAELLPGYMMILEQAPSCLVYTASNPLAGMDQAGLEPLLETAGFNLQAVSIYETADSTVVREGADTIRIQQDGTVLYHGSESGEARYRADTQREVDLRSKAEELLGVLVGERAGQGQFFCQKAQEQADGRVALSYCYLLDGVCVSLGERGWAAQFVFRGEDLISFEIAFRAYEATETPCAIPPERQAAAAAEAQGYGGKELQLCHRDDGSGQTTALWTARENG